MNLAGRREIDRAAGRTRDDADERGAEEKTPGAHEE